MCRGWGGGVTTYVAGLIKLFGIPEGVLNTGRSLSAISTAFCLKS